MRVAVLPDQVLLVVPTQGTQLADAAAHALRSAIAETLPGWRTVIFREGGDILDMRDDPDAAAAAGLLLDRLGTLV